MAMPAARRRRVCGALELDWGAEDFRVDGMVFCKLLLSPLAHARVSSIDTSKAACMPGVHAIFTGADFAEVGGNPAGDDQRANVWVGGARHVDVEEGAPHQEVRGFRRHVLG